MKPQTPTPKPKDQPTTLQALGDLLRDAELIREKSRQLVSTASRYGDLQVIASALLRATDNTRILIQEEEQP